LTAKEGMRDGSVTGVQTCPPPISGQPPDGPGGGSSQTISSVTGGGLTWTLRPRANSRPGTAEIWQAVASAAVSNVTVTATLSNRSEERRGRERGWGQGEGGSVMET